MSTDPRTINQYKILERLAKGGQGTIYKAETPNGSIVVLKLPHSRLESSLRRVSREIAIIKSFNHNNIVPIIDEGYYKGRHYYVMPFMKNASLASLIRRGYEFSLGEAIRFFGYLASALDYAHYRGVVHRDLKPENILLDDNFVPHITDFGIAKISYIQSSLTGTNIIGTPYYMSPEQILNHVLDSRSDIYSLGAILFEMLSGGHKLFRDSNLSRYMFMHLQSPIPEISQYRTDLPKQMQDVLELSLAKSRTERFMTAGGMLEAMKTAAFYQEIPSILLSNSANIGDDQHKNNPNMTSIVDALLKVLTGGPNGFTIIEGDRSRNCYVQFIYNKEHNMVLGEAVSGEYMIGPKRFSHAQAILLASSGWLHPSPKVSPNFTRIWEIDSDETWRQIAEEAIRVLIEVYGCDANETYNIILNLE